MSENSPKTSDKQPEWFTVPEAAERLLVETRTVRRWIEEGFFPGAVRTSPGRGRYRIPRADI